MLFAMVVDGLFLEWGYGIYTSDGQVPELSTLFDVKGNVTIIRWKHKYSGQLPLCIIASTGDICLAINGDHRLPE